MHFSGANALKLNHAVYSSGAMTGISGVANGTAKHVFLLCFSRNRIPVRDISVKRLSAGLRSLTLFNAKTLYEQAGT